MGTPRGSRSMGELLPSMAPPAGAEPEPPQDNEPNGASSSRATEIHPHKLLPLRGLASPVYSRSPSTPRSRQAALANLGAGVPSPRENGRLGSRLSSDDSPIRRAVSLSKKVKRKHSFDKKSIRNILALLLCISVFFLFDWWMLSQLREEPPLADDGLQHLPGLLQGEWSRFPKGDRPPGLMYGRMLGLAAHALAEGEFQDEPKELWEEPFADASVWKPCADKSIENFASRGRINSTGFIMVSANGGLNQQRVAICNAVAVARLLNATLVLPRFLYSSVWKDPSQFGDIYQESFFIDYLKDDVTIVKELPRELQSLDLEAIGSFVSDMDLMKEAKPSFYTTYILPILLRNRVVHFHGFGNRLAFDPVPFEIQRLRCKCNFHALKFVQKIQQAGALLIKRMREKSARWGPGHDQSKILEYDFTAPQLNSMHMLVTSEHFENTSVKLRDKDKTLEKRQIKYLGLHLRFEVDMAAYSMCEFGGGESEWHELEAYREIHFPTLTLYKNNGKLLSPAQLREEGKCPLTPEEAVLMLAALGFKRDTRIYLAGAHIFGGQSRMVALTSLYPNLVTKEDLLSHEELQPFRNRSSQLAALDFIGCAAADVFAMTDSGSQLSSLVSGYRMYYGGGLLPTIRPNKRRLASIFSKNTTIEWEEFRDRVKKMVKENKKVQVRRVARSIYRHPRCLECMCMTGTPRTE